MRHLTLITAMTLVGALPASAAPSCDVPLGAWKTNMNATVSIDALDAKTGHLSGSYQPASMPERKFPLTGFLNPAKDGEVGKRDYGVAISFAVSFQEFGGITSWNGVCHMVDGAPVIDTEDLIVAPIADAVWAHVIDNHDRLKPR